VKLFKDYYVCLCSINVERNRDGVVLCTTQKTTRTNSHGAEAETEVRGRYLQANGIHMHRSRFQFRQITKVFRGRWKFLALNLMQIELKYRRRDNSVVSYRAITITLHNRKPELHEATPSSMISENRLG
jgi:hypothetical protein